MTREQALEGNHLLICKVKNYEEDKYIHMSAREKNIRACMRVCKNCEWDLHKEIDERCEYYKVSEDRKEYVEMTNEEVKEYYFTEMLLEDSYSEKEKEIFIFDFFSKFGDSEKRKDFYKRLKNRVRMSERMMKIAYLDKWATLYKNLDELITTVYNKVNTEKSPQQELGGKAPETIPPIIQAVLNEGKFLESTPNKNDKYDKKAKIKDKEIIEWIIDYSGYHDVLSTEIYCEHIQETVKQKTIDDYITRAKNH